MQRWTTALRAADPTLSLLRAEWDGHEVDLSLYKYADYVYRYTLVALGDSMGTLSS